LEPETFLDLADTLGRAFTLAFAANFVRSRVTTPAWRSILDT
jgi:hypothetical protein